MLLIVLICIVWRIRGEKSRDSDTVKRVRLRGFGPGSPDIYAIAIVEHQSTVNFNIAVRIFQSRVMVYPGFERFIPQFEYSLVNLRDTTVEALVKKDDVRHFCLFLIRYGM
ncbi:MAG: hypothetical protein LBR16_05340 [Treponema sp.]|jgi:hypothetical protein|nr:hypothetical protein [Treponema sp.]